MVLHGRRPSHNLAMTSLHRCVRPRFRVYIIFLCVVYLLAMLIFHSDIQDSQPNPKPQFGLHEDVFPPMKMTLGPVDPTNTPAIRPIGTKGYSPGHVAPDWGTMPRMDVPMRHVKIKNNVSHISKCVGPDFGREHEFFELLPNKVYVFSAYWDDRQNDFDNKHNGSFIRIMGVVRWAITRPPLVCRFRGDGDVEAITVARYYEMCENHGRPLGGFIISCSVPGQIQGQPCSVEIGKDMSRFSYNMKVLPIRPREDKLNKFAICVPPLYGNLKKGKLVEFVELSKTLGADHITFYDFMVGDETARVLEYYQEKNTVTVVPWFYPESLSKWSWYYGQMVAIQDCLYRNMHTSELVAFNDVDEFFVPHKHSGWEQMAEALFQPDRCAYCFSSAFYPPQRQRNGTLVFSSTRRTHYLSSIRAKCIVRPYQIFEKGIHHVSKPVWAHSHVDRVSENIAFVHHYRLCIRDFAMNCKKYVVDEFMDKYAYVTTKIKHVVSLL